MKRFTVFLAIAVVVLFSAGFKNEVFAQGEVKGTITVNGTGTFRAKPDMAVISLGAESNANEAKSAQEECAKIMASVLAAVKELGIEDKDMQTNYFTVYPRYDIYPRYYDVNIGADSAGAESSYTAQYSVSVTVRDLDLVGTILDMAIEKGANTNGGMQFTISNPEKYYQDALKASVGDAKKKAGILASTMGVTINNPVSVTEQSSVSVMPIYQKSMDTVAGTMAAEANYTVPVETGEIDITARITAVFEY